MPQRHLDRLTAIDASFLHQEGPDSHMHVGGLTIIEGPAPPIEDLLEQIRERLHLVPRYRQKLAYTALDSGRPVWMTIPTSASSTTCATRRCQRPETGSSCSSLDREDLLPAARPRQAAVGDVADRGTAG